MNRMGAQVEHRRRRRGSGALRAGRERRLAPQRDQAGRVGPLRRHQRVPRQRDRPADQDGAGRQARRRRPAARPQGLSVDREGPLRDAGRRPDLAAAASRHLLDRGPRAADLRPEEREPEGAHPREAGRRSRRRHGRRRRRQGARRRRADLGPRRRHRRVAAHQHQARRRAVGARPRRDAAGAAAQRPARPHRRAGGRPDEDRPRRRDRRAAGRRGVRLRDRAARRLGLRDDARLPSEHLPGRHRDAGSGAAQEVHRQARVRRELLPVHRRGSARADGGARLPHDGRDDRARRSARTSQPAVDHWKAHGLDLSAILYDPPAAATHPRRNTTAQDHGLGRGARSAADRSCARDALETAAAVSSQRCRSAT